MPPPQAPSSAQTNPGQLPDGFNLDPPATSAGSNLSPAALHALNADAQAQIATTAVSDPSRLPSGFVLDRPAQSPAASSGAAPSPNPFDQFDPPAASKGAAPSPNPFDQFDTPAIAATPDWEHRLGGIIGRGLVDGATGLVSTAQAAGRFVESHTPSIPGISSLDARLESLPVQQLAANAESKDNWYAPQQASGKILEDATAGATGAALTGGSSLLPIAMGAGASAAPTAAKAAGASDATAGDIGLAAALLPAGFAGLGAARNVVGGAVRNAMSASLTKGMTPEQAGQVLLYNDALKQTQAAAAGGKMSTVAAANSLKGDLANSIGDYTRAAQGAGYVGQPQAADIRTALAQATSHKNGLTNAPAGAFSGVRSLTLPDGHGEALQGALQQLDIGSGQGFYNASQGLFTQLAQKAARPIAFGSALLAGANGDLVHAAELAGAGILGHGTPLATVAGKAGQIADRLFGTALTPAEAQQFGAQRIVNRSGYLPSQQPLTALSQATGQAQADASDPFLQAQRQFELSGGMRGSPVEAFPPNVAGWTAPVGQARAPGSPATGASQTPVGLATGPSTPTSPTPLPGQPQGPSTVLPGSPRPVGGQALVSQIVSSHYGGTAPLAPEIMTAANDLAADGIGGGHFDALSSGQLVHPDYAHLVAQRLLATRQQTVGNEATQDVQQAMGGAPVAAVPNSPDRGPVRNPARYQAVVSSRQRHAQNMITLATSPAEKQAISQVAAEPTAAGKSAVLQTYATQNPGADLSRFTPQLMQGV